MHPGLGFFGRLTYTWVAPARADEIGVTCDRNRSNRSFGPKTEIPGNEGVALESLIFSRRVLSRSKKPDIHFPRYTMYSIQGIDVRDKIHNNYVAEAVAIRRRLV